MQEVIKNLLMQVSAYLLILIAIFMFINFLTKGFLFKYLRIKSGRGKFLFVRVCSLTGKYYAVAKFKKGFWQFKNRDKSVVSITPTKNNIFDEMGVKTVEYDEETTCLVNAFTNEAMQGSDPVKVDSLLSRILMAPSIQTNIHLIIIIVLCVLTLLATFYCVFMLIKITKAIALLNTVGAVV